MRCQIPASLLRNLDGKNATVDIQPSAEAAAEQMIVDLDRILRQAGELSNHGLGQGRCLGADPDVAAILAEMDGAVHRLHRRMGEERELINASSRCAALASAFYYDRLGFQLMTWEQWLAQTGVKQPVQ
jgi:hypothetical protein